MSHFTQADFNSWRFTRDAVHYNGGKVWFGHGHQCIDQPRLLVIDKYFRADRSTKRSFQVDGKTTFATLDEALAALGKEPELTADELSLLQSLPEGWSSPSPRHPYVALGYMGFVEWGRDEQNHVMLRPTAAGLVAGGRK